MGIVEFVHRGVDRVANFPGIKQVRMRRYEQRFAAATSGNSYRGVYASFAQALASAPQSKPVGYDNPESATIYVGKTDRIFPSDYPVICWLQKLWLGGLTRVFDLGGNIAVSYRAYHRFAVYPTALRWIVHDVPAVIKLGHDWAVEHDRQGHLAFTEDPHDASGTEILLVNGALQYLPYEFDQLLQELATLPSHLLINRLPLHRTESFFTVQNIGSAFCPYRVLSASRFVASITNLGYSLVDRWNVPELDCNIPFAPTHSINGYQGMLFSLPSWR